LIGDDGQLLAIDLRVMTDVDRERAVWQEVADFVSVSEACGDLDQLTRNRFMIDIRCEWFVHNHRRLPAARADANECRASHVGVSVEHRFAAFRVERAVGGFDAMRFPTAVPEAALAIEIADVADAMPDSIAVWDFGVLIRSAVW
jgi:hypothetical protein